MPRGRNRNFFMAEPNSPAVRRRKEARWAVCIHLSLHIPSNTHFPFITLLSLSPLRYRYSSGHHTSLFISPPSAGLSNSLYVTLCSSISCVWISFFFWVINADARTRSRSTQCLAGAHLKPGHVGVAQQRSTAGGNSLSWFYCLRRLGPSYLWAPPENCFLIKIVHSRGPGPLYLPCALEKPPGWRDGSGAGGKEGRWWRWRGAGVVFLRCSQSHTHTRSAKKEENGPVR